MQRGQPLRLVLDTNIVVSALLWQGPPRRLLQLSSERDRVLLFTSDALLDELRNTLGYRKFAKRLTDAESTVEEVVALYKAVVETVVSAPIERFVPRDKDDDMVVATAIGAKAHAIISGDRHLTEFEQIAGIIVLRAAEAIELIEVQK